jgi:hypothetical protein
MLYPQVLEVVERVAADGTILKSMTHGYRYLANEWLSWQGRWGLIGCFSIDRAGDKLRRVGSLILTINEGCYVIISHLN